MTQILTATSKLLCLATIVALLGACAGVGFEPEPGNDNGKEIVPQPVETAPKAYQFYPGDELAISAVNRPELTVTARVDPSGNITYPYLGQVNVRNLTAEQVSERLARGLQEGGYYSRVHIGVALMSSRDQFVYVLGEVKKPGQVLISGSISLLEA